MEVAIHLPDDVAAAVPWEDVPRHLVENLDLCRYFCCYDTSLNSISSS
jgi:hypothetical protein